MSCRVHVFSLSLLLVAACGDGAPSTTVSTEGRPSVAALARDLERVSERARIDAARELAQLGSEAGLAVPALARASGDSAEEVRFHVVTALVATGAGRPVAIRALVALQGDISPRVASAARRGLDALNPPERIAHRVLSPAMYETIVRRVLVSPARTKEIQIPAQYETRNGKAVVVKPATTREEVIPAVYEEVEEQVLVKPAADRWEWTGGDVKPGVDIDWGPKGT